MKTVMIPMCRDTLNGTFCRADPPVAELESGDTLVCSCMDGDWHTAKPMRPESNSGPFFEERRTLEDWGHALIGPIAVKGAKPGMTLAVHILENRPANWGWSRVGGGKSPHVCALGLCEKQEFFLNWDLDVKRMVGVSHLGHVVSLSPFLGVLGVAPDCDERVSTHPPRAAGGNLDCRDLVPGSVLYLPVFCDGALLYVGDGHALQGQGELGGTAIECPMDRIELRVELHPDLHINMPRARTPKGWITFGFDEDLTKASYQALNEMVQLMMEQYCVTREEALALASLVVDEYVTQIVNGVRGIHAVLPHGAIATRLFSGVDPRSYNSK